MNSNKYLRDIFERLDNLTVKYDSMSSIENHRLIIDKCSFDGKLNEDVVLTGRDFEKHIRKKGYHLDGFQEDAELNELYVKCAVKSINKAVDKIRNTDNKYLCPIDCLDSDIYTKIRGDIGVNTRDYIIKALAEKDGVINKWDEAKEFMKNDMLESLAIQLSHEYEDEADFEDKFGPTDSFENVVSLFLEYKCSEDIDYYVEGYIEAYPLFKDKILSSFELEEEKEI